MSKNMSWTIRIALLLVVAVLFADLIESRTRFFSNLFPSVYGLPTQESELKTELGYLRKDRDRLRSELESSRQDLFQLDRELRKLEQHNWALEEKIEQQQASAVAGLDDRENSDDAVLNQVKHLEIEALLENAARQLQKPSVVNARLPQADIAASCGAEAQKLLRAWLRFKQLYSNLDLAAANIDLRALKQLNLVKLALVESIPAEQFIWLEPLVKNLLEYYEVLTSAPDWRARLEQINQSADKDRLIDAIYQAGYPRSSDPCMTSGFLASVSWYRGGFSGRVYLERWLYTFWLRRYAEGTMEASLLGLRLVNQTIDAAEPSSGQDFIFVHNEQPLADKSGVNRYLREQYQRLILSVPVNNKVVFWVGDRLEPPLRKKLYVYSGPKHGQEIIYQETRSNSLMDQDEVTHGQVYSSPGPDRPQVSLYSAQELDPPVKSFRKTETTAQDRHAIGELLVDTYGTPWVLEETIEGKRLCPTEPGRIATFVGAGTRVHIVTVDCTEWTGEGNSGPYASLVIVSGPTAKPQLRHQYFGTNGLIQIGAGLINDLDNDGNIEVLLNRRGGLSSHLDLVELDRNSWHLLREVKSQSEGIYEELLDMGTNIELLYR